MYMVEQVGVEPTKSLDHRVTACSPHQWGAVPYMAPEEGVEPSE